MHFLGKARESGLIFWPRILQGKLEKMVLHLPCTFQGRYNEIILLFGMHFLEKVRGNGFILVRKN